MFKKTSFFLIFLLFFGVGEGKQPQLTPKDVRSKIEEVLKAHVCHKSLNQELMGRVFRNFLEELDPTKTYFLEKEVTLWWDPAPEILQKALQGYKTSDFTLFEEIHKAFLRGIERRS